MYMYKCIKIEDYSTPLPLGMQASGHVERCDVDR